METKVYRSKSGIPCLWERGGGYSHTGTATIICSPNGHPKRAIYVARKGMLACGEHALIPIAVDDYIITAKHHREDFDITIYRIAKINADTADIEFGTEFSNGEWREPLPPAEFEAAVQAAQEKATCYHCRSPHYILA